MKKLDPKEEAEKLSDRVSKLALEVHGDDKAAGNKLIDQIIEGKSIWAVATRGMARCKYGIMLCDKTPHQVRHGG